MKVIIFSILTFLISTANASFEQKGIGASHTGLSLSGSASRVADFSVISNPSLINGKPAFDFFYRTYFGIKELNQMAIHSEFSSFNHPFAVAVTRFGNNLYAETEFTAGTSFQPTSHFLLGVSVTSYFLQIKNYGDAVSLGLNFSVLYQINDQIRVAGVVHNLNEPRIGASHEKIPLSGIVGLSYLPISEVELLLDGYKEDFYDFSYRLGTRIHVIPSINLLAGLQNRINSFSVGIEFNQNNYTLKYSVDIHPVLNASHILGFNYVL